MTLDKAIEHGKEHRKPYRGGKAIDKTCRNHGGCPACLSNRMWRVNKLTEKSEIDLSEDIQDNDDREHDEDS